MKSTEQYDDKAGDESNNVPFNSSQSQPAKKIRKQSRPKVQSDWSPEQVTKLIEAVEERRVLWDKSLEEYKHPSLSAWEGVAETIAHGTPDECKAKWTNLRITFNINLAKYRSKKSGQGTDENFKITWKHFQSMLFLEAADVHQSTESTSSLSLVIIYRSTHVILDLLLFFLHFTAVLYH